MDTNNSLESKSKAKSRLGERLKKQGIFILGVLVLLFLVGTVSESNRVNEADAKARAIDAKNAKRDTCFDITDEDLAMKAGPVGSSSRQLAVDTFYAEIVESPCVLWKNDLITTNPFYLVKKSDFNSTTLHLAYFETLRGWNGLETLGGLTCADGWESPSIGKSGACSHHGGVVSKFQSNIKYQLNSALTRAGIQTIYTPGSTLIRKTSKSGGANG